MVRNVNVLAEMSSGDEAMLLYDLDTELLGSLRVVEHFTVAEGNGHQAPANPRHRPCPCRGTGVQRSVSRHRRDVRRGKLTRLRHHAHIGEKFYRADPNSRAAPPVSGSASSSR
jgi:hypothetical protein